MVAFLKLFCLQHIQSSLVDTSSFRETCNLVRTLKLLHRSWLAARVAGDARGLSCRVGGTLAVVTSARRDTMAAISQITTYGELCGSRWIFFANNEDDIIERFQHMYIPFNCIFRVVRPTGSELRITEIYKIDETYSLQTYDYGTWDTTNGLQVEASNLYSRRRSLHGRRFSAVSYASVNNVLGENLLETLTYATNSTYEVSTYSGLVPGNQKEDKSWTGVIGLLQQGSAEIITDLLTVTASRVNAVDFSSPATTDKFGLFIKDEVYTDVNRWSFVSPFETTLWMAVIGTILLYMLCVTVMNLASYDKNPQCSTKEILMGIFAAFCLRGYSLLLPRWSLRLAYLSAFITAVVIHAAYCARVVSHLANSNRSLPFTDLEEAYAAGYEIQVVPGTSAAETFKYASDGIIRTINEEMIEPRYFYLPVTINEGLLHMCNWKKTCFVSERNSVRCSQKQPCGIIEVSVTMPSVYLAFALRKKSPFRRIISYQMEKLRTGGILKRLKSTSCNRAQADQGSDFKRVQLKNAAPLLAIIYFAVIISFLVVILERALFRYTQKTNSKSVPKFRKYRKRIRQTPKYLP